MDAARNSLAVKGRLFCPHTGQSSGAGEGMLTTALCADERTFAYQVDC